MKEETVVNQQAQDQASASSFVTLLFGQSVPSFMGLPVLQENLYEPPKGVRLHNIQGAPGQIRGHQVAVVFFAFIFEGDDEAFSLMGGIR